MLRLIKVMVAAALMAPPVCHAASLEAYPTAWRMEDYSGGPVSLYYTGAAGCTSGKVAFGAGGTEDDRNRLWSLVLLARAANKKVGIIYSGSGTACTIDSFYLVENS